MSGSAISFGNRQPATAADAWSLTASRLGCGNATTTSASTILTCMRSQNATTLLAASLAIGPAFASTLNTTAARLYEGIIGPFGPTIDNVTVFDNYTQRAAARQFIPRPVLVGNSDAEACYFAEIGGIPAAEQDLITTIVFTCPAYHIARARAQAGVPAWQYRFFGSSSHTFSCILLKLLFSAPRR